MFTPSCDECQAPISPIYAWGCKTEFFASENSLPPRSGATRADGRLQPPENGSKTTLRRGATPDNRLQVCGAAPQASLRDARSLGGLVPWAEATRLLSPHRDAMEKPTAPLS